MQQGALTCCPPFCGTGSAIDSTRLPLGGLRQRSNPSIHDDSLIETAKIDHVHQTGLEPDGKAVDDDGPRQSLRRWIGYRPHHIRSVYQSSSHTKIRADATTLELSRLAF
jgi:hypothetical protein